MTDMDKAIGAYCKMMKVADWSREFNRLKKIHGSDDAVWNYILREAEVFLRDGLPMDIDCDAQDLLEDIRVTDAYGNIVHNARKVQPGWKIRITKNAAAKSICCYCRSEMITSSDHIDLQVFGDRDVITIFIGKTSQDELAVNVITGDLMFA